MSLTQTTAAATFLPACYQDLLDGRTIYQQIGEKMIEIVPGSGQHCSTLSGDTYLFGWKWKDIELGGGHGHLHKQRFKSLPEYRINTESTCRLFIQSN